MATEELSETERERIYGDRPCPFDGCEYVAAGEFDLGEHGARVHKLAFPRLDPRSFVSPVLVANADLLDRLATIEATQQQIVGFLLGFATDLGRVRVLLDRFESSPWGKMLRAHKQG